MRSKKEGFIGERQVKLSPMVVDIEEHDPLTKGDKTKCIN